MPEAQFDVERATGGLVMALFVASALLLAGLLYFVLQDMDRRVKDEHSDQDLIMQHTASWHNDEASRGQKKFLDRLGVDYPAGISKGDASALIDAKKALQRREKSAA